MTETRRQLLSRLAARLDAQPAAPVLRVAVDGVDGAGKTTFADELADALRALGRDVLRASVDGFHHPRERRYRVGRDSPEGFYRDSYDHAALRRVLLDPLGPGGSGRYQTAVFDVDRDVPVQVPERQAPAGSVLIVDGLFLHRPELRGAWDDSVFLRVPFEVSVPRGAARGPGYGSPDPEAPSNRRYIGGNRLYFREADPERQAGVIVDNADLTRPVIVRERPLAP
ncbi:uridine kinase [Deinococcus enclensis]|uniref:Uridine kinase n=1 Tax=Deinococcus enclensis TaxID=1049582 RepID=A0ABT9M997_9DEIO|nr:uridine kinase [Deinococcus enclensis]MDP9763091.1 uridine kinase [Deinococcus enclensis]